MAYVLVKKPIDTEELATRILRLLRKYDQGVRRSSLVDSLLEVPEEGEGGVWCEEDECERALSILRERSLIEEVDDQSPRGGKVLRSR